MRSLKDLASVLRKTAELERDTAASFSEFGAGNIGTACLRIAEQMEIAAGHVEKGEFKEIADLEDAVRDALDFLTGWTGDGNVKPEVAIDILNNALRARQG